MRLGGCVVLFNPADDVVDNVETYLPFLGELVVVDNSTVSSSAVSEIASMNGVRYLSMGGNMGIAAALNAGCHALMEDGFDVALTMDQDSKFPVDDAIQILSKVEDLLGEYALVGLNFNAADSAQSDEITEAKYWLTSGNFLSLCAYEMVDGFDGSLFIDYVDIEFGHRLKNAGLKLCYLNNYSLVHEIGSPIEIKLLGHTFFAMNHSAIRYYYRYRNSRYLYGTDKAFYRDKYYRELFVNIPKMLLFEPNKAAKLKMIRRGLADGRRGLLGAYQEGDSK